MQQQLIRPEAPVIQRNQHGNFVQMEDRLEEPLPFELINLWAIDFRRFSQINFKPGNLTILVGVNGSGKSSVLDAAAILLSRVSARIISGKSGGRRIGPWDIRNTASGSFLIGVIAAENALYQFANSTARTGRKLNIATMDHQPRMVEKGTATPVQGLSELADVFRERLTHDSNASIPVLATYRVNRAVLDIPLRIKKRHKFDQIAAYDDVFSSTSSFRSFFEWFREREDVENELRLDNVDYRDTQLNAVRKAIITFMPDYLDLRVRRNPLRMTVTKDGQEVLVNQLSDGEKALLSLVGDLARRLAIANPSLANPLTGSGIALIDEIELHLHPRWQRHSIEQLPVVFPNLQFFITTHSAVVANSAPPGSLFALRDGEIEPVNAFGQDIGDVLEEIFGTSSRPEGVQRRVDQLFRLIEEDLSKAEPLLAELEEELPPEDDVLVRAHARIARRKR